MPRRALPGGGMAPGTGRGSPRASSGKLRQAPEASEKLGQDLTHPPRTSSSELPGVQLFAPGRINLRPGLFRFSTKSGVRVEPANKLPAKPTLWP